METPLKIKSPKTGRMITVGKGEYNKLLTQYTENYLLSLGDVKIQPQELPEDVIYSIIMQSDIEEIINLYDINNTYRTVLNKPHVLKELSSIYLHNINIKTFDDFLKRYLDGRSNSKLDFYIVYQLLKEENAAISIDYAHKVIHVLEKLIEVLYDRWIYNNYNVYARYSGQNYGKITKGDISKLIQKDTALSKYLVKNNSPPIMTKTIRKDVAIDNEDIKVINQLLSEIVKQFAHNGQKEFRKTVKKILTRKYEKYF